MEHGTRSGGIHNVPTDTLTRNQLYKLRGEEPPETNGNGTAKRCEGCGTAIEGARKWCSDACKKRTVRARARAAPAPAPTLTRETIEKVSPVSAPVPPVVKPLDSSAGMHDLVVELARGLPATGMLCATFEFSNGLSVTIGRAE
jgi:hypothetical protein